MKVLPFTIPVAEDRSVIVQKDDLPFFYPHLHRHQEIQLTWIRQGEGTLVAENNMHAFRPDEIYWLGANQPHVFKSDPSYFPAGSQKRVRTLNIFFQAGGRLDPFFSLPEIRSLKRFLEQHQSGFKVPAAQTQAIAAAMQGVQHSSGPERFTRFISLLKELSTLKDLAPLSARSWPAACSEHEGLRISAIYHYILTRFDQPITLEEVSGQAHMTPQAFCRYFKRHTRHTFVSFLNEVRIHEACKKLAEGNFDSIAAVAYTCGFNSITNFNRVFRHVTCQSPSEYAGSWDSLKAPAATPPEKLPALQPGSGS